MEAVKYQELGTDWQTDSAIECCQNDPNSTPPGCDCCYDSWTEELKKVKREFNRVNEQANQYNEQYKFTAAERDKLKAWLDDLIKADQLAKAVCDQFEIMGSQTDKICTNSGKSVKAIEILFCMVRDLYRQIDVILTTYNQIWACIKCLNSSEISETSGIGKCLKMYYEKLDAVVKTRMELIKAIMTAIKTAYVLHEEICSEYGLKKVIEEWQGIMNCDEKCGSPKPPADPCKDQVKDNENAMTHCALIPILTLPVCNDPYYAWVKKKYEDDVAEANDLAAKLVAANKKKEALAACQSSLVAAIKEVNPKELCK